MPDGLKETRSFGERFIPETVVVTKLRRRRTLFREGGLIRAIHGMDI
jgi:hypothetical protein